MSSWMKETYGEKHQFHIKDYYLNKRAKYLNDKLNIDLMKGKNVLDIAIGSNQYIYSLNFENKYAIELDDNFIKEHKNNGINVFSYDLNEGLPENIITNKYELVFALEIGEHLLNGNKFFQSISNCLTDTGVLIVSLPNDMGFYLNRIETFYRGHPYGKNKTNIYEEQHIRFFSLSLAIATLGNFFTIEHIGGLNMNQFKGKRGILGSPPLKNYLADRFPSFMATNFIFKLRKKK